MDNFERNSLIKAMAENGVPQVTIAKSLRDAESIKGVSQSYVNMVVNNDEKKVVNNG